MAPRLSFTKLGGIVWRRYVTDGVPLSGINEPDKDDIKTWTEEIERYIDNAYSAGNLLNGKLSISAASGILTVSVKTLAGADPSPTDPVYAITRAAGDTDGDFEIAVLTAALSLAIPSGATLGAVANTAFRVWFVIVLDGANARIGAVNLVSLAAGVTTIYPLTLHQLLSSTAVDSGADSAGVVYTDSAATSKPAMLLGSATWQSGLAVPGTWVAPSRYGLHFDADKLPGQEVQRVSQWTGAVATGTTTIPHDDTIPTSSEGTQVMSQAITPKSQANVLHVRAFVMGAISAAVHLIAALFNDTVGAAALVAAANKNTASGDVGQITLEYYQVAGQITALTFTVRAGPSAAGTFTFNGAAGARLYGGVAYSSLEIREIMA